SGAEIDCFRC
ncbi:hypothetical protein RRG08_058449, partial [Elysia crispata]